LIHLADLTSGANQQANFDCPLRNPNFLGNRLGLRAQRRFSNWAGILGNKPTHFRGGIATQYSQFGGSGV